MTAQPAAAPGEPVRAARYRSDRSYLRCAGEGEKVVLAFPYDAALVGEAKAIGGRHFDWNTRTNIFPFDRLPQVVAFADAHGIEVTQQVRALIHSAARWVRHERAASLTKVTREAAHLYLRHGLLPVPAWAAGNDGACRCPRGAGCARPGKHPRSVHAGPGPNDYSWRPLACSTHEEVEQRFASDGQYAAANLMLAIPEGMLVIDQDYDDGGRQAVAALAERFGELPATLSHDTPNGCHRIYRTPAGWTTRAWVGKDASNPLPAGVDLRVPGQILMAPPSRVPGTHGLARYGPVIGTAVADLPAVYIAAWTPHEEHPRMARPVALVPPGRADAAASYVHARISGITEDLATRKPGGRNTAIYTAALKVGSTLGAARSTLGAEHAAAAWTDEAAEDALMTASEQNGYIADHSAAAARAAIRSGLRNGFRRPRPLPDFGSRQAARGLAPPGERARQGTSASSAAQPASTGRDPAASREPDAASSASRPAASGREESAIRHVLASKEAESGERQGLVPGQRCQAGAGDWREAIVEKGREESRSAWPPGVAVPEPTATGRAMAALRESNGSPDWRETVIRKQRQAWQPQVTQPDDPELRHMEAAEQQVGT